jgi:hypothetical protein
MRRSPAEFLPSLGGAHALIEQEDLGEAVAHACADLFLRAGNRAWSTDGNGGRLGERSDRRVGDLSVLTRG